MTETTSRLSAALADRYRIERELGQGGMATVYLAEDLKHERQVAVKVLRPELAAVLGAERFVQEIKTTANLQHPHILPLFDSGTADGFLFYVMPFIDGETIRDKLNRETQFGIDEAVRIAKEVADALDYAHRNGIIHRDIKPENILLHDGRPMVADFGIALAVSAAAGGRMTETGLSLGTPHYMSPEQATAEKDLTARADVYSLGAVLYEMLAGEPPHMGNSAQQIIMKIVTDDARPVTELRKSVPPNVAAAAARALEKLPADRFSSAAEFKDALERSDFGAGATARAAAAGQEQPPAALARRAAPWVLLVVAAVVGAMGWLRERPSPQPNSYRVELRDGGFFPAQVGRDLILSRDGQTIVFGDTVGGQRLWIKTPGRAEAVPITGTESGRGPAFSPDEEWIVFASEGRVRKVPRVGGSAVTIADSANPFIPAHAWLEDGTVLFEDTRFRLRGVDQDGGPVRQFVTPDTAMPAVVAMAGLAGGRTALAIICSAFCNTSRLMVLDLETGGMEPLGDDIIRAWPVAGGRVVFVRNDGGVFVAPFDAGDRRFSRPPVPVLDGVRTGPTYADIAVAFDGTLLYVPGPTAGRQGFLLQVVRVSRDGAETPVEPGWEIERANLNGGMALSPDGRRLALAVTASGSDDIYVKELEDGPFTRLTFEGSNFRPEWTADGLSVLYINQSGAGAIVVRRRADGTGSPDTLVLAGTGLNSRIFEVRRTPDSMRLLVRRGATNRDLFAVDLAREMFGDTALTPLLANPDYSEHSMMLSPDGRWLAYVSSESGNNEVFVRPYPDVDGGRWQVSRDGGVEPVWSHSGAELFYRDGEENLVSVSVPATGAFRPGGRRVLFNTSRYWADPDHAQYAVTPDDQYFYFVKQLNDGSEGEFPAILVLNWLDGLDRDRPSGGR